MGRTSQHGTGACHPACRREKRKKALLNHFKDIEAIKKATFEELLEVEGMNKASSESVYNYFRKG